MKNKIGEKVTITEDFEIVTCIGKKALVVKKGDKGFIDSQGNIHYITGAARGKIQNLKGTEVEGYDTESITKLISKKLNGYFDLEIILKEYDIDLKDFENQINETLDEIF